MLALLLDLLRVLGGVLVGRLRRGPLRPGWSFRTELVSAVMRRTLMASKTRGIPWLRQATGALPESSAAIRRVRFEPVLADGVACEWCASADEPHPDRAILYLHGGGYVIGGVDGHRDVIARLALGVGARVLAVDYRLAPEHRFPAAHDDCLAAYRWLLAQGLTPERVAVAGDSAGGALSVATMISARDAGDPLPACGVLISPWVDPLASGGSMDDNEPFDFGDRELLVGWIRQYMGEEDPKHPLVTLMDADLHGLPPLCIQAGGAEILLDQIRAFAERARAAGVDVDCEVVPDMFHVFQIVANLLPEGVVAVDRLCAVLRARLAGS